jgi:hypothetical protein
VRTLYEHRLRSYKRGTSAHAEIPAPADTQKTRHNWWRFHRA